MEITTLKDLKTLVEQLKALNKQKKDIFSNDDLSKNQMERRWAKLEPKQKEIQDALAKYFYIFDVKRKDLNLVEHFKNYNLDVVFDSTFLQTEMTSEGFYRDHTFYDIIFKDTLEVRHKNKTEKILLIHFNESSCVYYDDIKFYSGDYLLLRT